MSWIFSCQYGKHILNLENKMEYIKRTSDVDIATFVNMYIHMFPYSEYCIKFNIFL